MTASRMRRRLLGVAAGAAAVTLATATTASAHFCYNDKWNEAAAQAVAANNTPWTPISDVAAMFVIPEAFPGCAEQAGAVADAAVADWMAEFGVDSEPLIFGNTTLARGNLMHGNGQGIKHLTDADFANLEAALFAAATEAGCA